MGDKSSNQGGESDKETSGEPSMEGDDQGVITDSQKAIFKSFPFLLFRPREEDVQLDLRMLFNLTSMNIQSIRVLSFSWYRAQIRYYLA